MLYPLDFICP